MLLARAYCLLGAALLTGILAWGPYSARAATIQEHRFGDGQSCSLLLVRPHAIPRTVREVYPIELSHAGHIYTDRRQFQHLPDGEYVFLVTDKMEWLVAKKYDGVEYSHTGKGLATHKSLLRMYEIVTGHPVGEIFASGEMQIFNHLIYRISNYSGNFRGSPANLDFGVVLLKILGVPFAEGYKKVAFGESSESDENERNWFASAHSREARELDQRRLEDLATVANSPLGEAYYSMFTRLAHIVSDVFSDLPLKTQFEKTAEAMRAGGRVTGARASILSVTYPILQVATPDGLAFGVIRVMPAGRLHIDMPAQIHNFILGYRILHGRGLPDAIVTRLNSLSHDVSLTID